MANDLKKLDSLIFEVLKEKKILSEKLPFDFDTFSKLFGDPIAPKGFPSKEKIPPEDIWDLPQHGTSDNTLNIDDIEWYRNNANSEEFDVQVERKLIAIVQKFKNYTGIDPQGPIPEQPKVSAKFIEKLNSEREKQQIKYDTQKAKKDALDKKGKKSGTPARHMRNAETAMAKIDAHLAFLQDTENLRDLGLLAKAASEAYSAKQDAMKAASGRKQTVSAPTVKSQAGEIGQYPTEITTVIDRIFGQDSRASIRDRMQMISEISEVYYNAAKGQEAAIEALNKKPNSQIISEVQLLDVFNSLAKEFDGGAGAYLFEYFLAAMAGGKIEGKETTEAGKMGATDFTRRDKDGNVLENGSAKYYSKGGGIGQAVGGFEDIWKKKNIRDGHMISNEPVGISYVIAIKKQDEDQFDDTKRGVSDPQRLMAVQIYAPEVIYNGPEQGFAIDGKPIGHPQPNKHGHTEVPISSHLGDSVGIIRIAMINTQTFREMINGALDQKKVKAKLAFKVFQEYYDALEKASSGAKVYNNTGKIQAGNEVFDNLETAEARFTVFVSELEHGHKAQSDEYGTRIYDADQKFYQEGKLGELDKLILEVFQEEISK